MDQTEIKSRLAELLTVQHGLVLGANHQGRSMNGEESKRYDEMEQEVAELRTELNKHDGGGSSPVHLADWNSGKKQRDADLFTKRRTWAEIFGREPRPLSRKLTFSEFVKGVHDHDLEALRELRSMNETTGVEGGFSIPEPLWAGIYNSAVEVSVVLDLVNNFPMSTDTLKIASWDNADQTQGPLARIEPEWLGELGSGTRKTPALKLLELSAKKCALYIQTSYEVMSDSVALAASLGPLLRDSLAFAIDEAVLTGSGTGRPLGVLNAPSAVTQPRGTAGDIVFADLAGMVGKILPSSLSRATWVVSPSAFAKILTVEVAANSGVLVLQGSAGVANRIPLSLFGCPLRVSEKLPTLGQKGDVMLCDFSFYAFGQRESGRLEKTNAAGWLQDALDFRLIHRLDGWPLISTPFVARKGGSTLSPFVLLAGA